MRVDIMYVCIHQKLKDKARGGFINRKDVLFILGCLYHIPKEHRQKVIKNLEEYKMIRQNGRNEIEVLK